MAKFNENNQPTRGRSKSFKTKLLDAIKAKALLNATPEMNAEQVEALFIQHLAFEALKEVSPDQYLMKDLMNRSFPALKPTMDSYDFELDADATPFQKADAILVAVSTGVIPPDVGTMLIGAAKNALDIEALTELKDRIAKLESLYEKAQSE